jgi:hypothetical protein
VPECDPESILGGEKLNVCPPDALLKDRDDPGQGFLFFKYFLGGFFSYYIQHCFICRPSVSTVLTDAGIEPRTVAIGALAVRRSNH